MLILELPSTAVWAGTELDLNRFIDMSGLVPEGARMSTLASRPLGALLPTGQCAWLGFRVAELAQRFGCAADRVQAAVRLALWPAVVQPQASDLDLRDATG